MGPSFPPPRKKAQPTIFGHVYCGQTAVWIKMPLGTPLGTEVDLGPGHIVLDGDPALPLERGTAAPTSFRPMSTVARPRSPI